MVTLVSSKTKELGKATVPYWLIVFKGRWSKRRTVPGGVVFCPLHRVLEVFTQLEATRVGRGI